MLICQIALVWAFRQVTSDGPVPQVSDLSSAVKRLASQMNSTVTLQPSLKDLRVAIWPRGEKPEVLLRSIALASHASLEKQGNSLILQRTKGDQAKILELDRGRVASALSETISSWDRATESSNKGLTTVQQTAAATNIYLSAIDELKKHQADPDFDPRQLKSPPNPSPFLPAGRLFRSVVQRVGISKIADIGPEEDAFYSNFPVADEILLPPIGDILVKYCEEREELRTQSSELVDQRIWSEILGSNFNRVVSSPLASEVKVVLHVHRDVQWLYCTLYCFDSEGKLLDRSGDATVPRVPLSSLASEVSPLFFDKRTHWLDLSEADKLYCKCFDFFQFTSPAHAENIHYSKESRLSDFKSASKMAINPDLYEPDKFVLPQGLTVFQQDEQETPMVCILPDQAWDDALESIQGNRINMDAFRYLTLKGGVRGPLLEESRFEGVKVVRPIDPIVEEFVQADRKTLARFIDRVATDGNVSLRVWSVFQNEMGPSGKNVLTTKYLEHVESAHQWMRTAGSGFFFRFVGGLTEEDWRTLMTGGIVNVSTSRQANLLHSSIVSGDWKIGSKTPLTQLQTQPQELYQETVQPAVSIRLATMVEQIVHYWTGSKQDVTFGVPSTLQEAGESLGRIVAIFKRAHRRDQASMSDSEALDRILSNKALKFRTATRRDYKFTVGNPEGIFLEKILSDESDLGDEVYHFDELPQDCQDSLRRAALRTASVPGR